MVSEDRTHLENVRGVGTLPHLHVGKNQLELMAAGERPIVREDFDKAFFGDTVLDSAVSCLSAKYHSQTGQTTSKTDDELTWQLPGWGQAKSDCGEYLKAVGCPDHAQPTLSGAKHTRKVILKHCFNPECPICYVPWAVREGTAAADRMKAAERLYLREGDDLQDARHFTFSPPQAAAIELIKTKKGYKRLKAFAIKLIKKAGIRGGAVIFHSHRVNRHKQRYLSPHFHVVGYGYVQNTKQFHKASAGWVYKNMGTRASLAGTIIYALDHCGLAYEQGNTKRIGHALTWFGLLSYNKIAKESVTTVEQTVPCKACSTDLHEYALVVNPGGHGMLPDWSKDEGVFHIKVKIIVYKLSKNKVKNMKKMKKKNYEFVRFERVP